MRRLLIADDERPVLDGIALIVRRELQGEFEVAGMASSGVDAIAKAESLRPDIILMDVRMPGLSGLDAIREMKGRGVTSAFILVTAYERFDIAREAVELGVIDYLLKPISRDRLAVALRAASESISRRVELERRGMERRELEDATRAFAETALLHTIILGEPLGRGLAAYRAALGITARFALAAAATFTPRIGDADPAEATRTLHERFRATLRYKTEAIAGTLVAGRSIVVLPLRTEDAGESGGRDFATVLSQAFVEELAGGSLRVRIGPVRSFERVGESWAEALRASLVVAPGGDGEALAFAAPVSAMPDRENPATDFREAFEEEEKFVEGLTSSFPGRACGELERLTLKMQARGQVDPVIRFRLISILGTAYRLLARRGLLDPLEALRLFDFSDLAAASDADTLEVASRARMCAIESLAPRIPRYSPPVARAIAFVKESYGGQIGLEAAAEVVGLSPNRLSRLFVEETGRGFSDYLIDYRLERAKQLLSQPGAAVKQVSAVCGYPDPNYFSRLFKKATGLTPTAFASGVSEEEDDGV